MQGTMINLLQAWISACILCSVVYKDTAVFATPIPTDQFPRPYQLVRQYLLPQLCDVFQAMADTHIGKIPAHSIGNAYWNDKVVYLDQLRDREPTLHPL